MSESKEITLIETGLASMDRVAAGIAELATKYKGVIFDVLTAEGMEAAREARRAIKTPRVDVEKIRKEAKAPLLALGRKLDAEAERITRELEALENPIDAQIKKEEGRIEAERQAKIRVEQERVAAIQARIAQFRSAVEMVLRTPSISSEKISAHLDDLVAIEIDDSFAEFKGNADIEKMDAVTRLTELAAAAMTREQDAARVKAEREELARARAAQEAADAEARAKRDAEVALENARLAAERKLFEEEQAVAREAARVENERIRAAQDAENAKITAERKRLADLETARVAEEKRVADARAQAEREEAERKGREMQEAADKRQREADAQRKASLVPSFEDIAQVVADHYQVDIIVARQWIEAASLAR